MHGLREHAVERTRGRARGGLGAGLDQVGDGFGLGQVQLVVEEGAARELAGLGHAQADAVAGPQAARQQQLHHHRAAVALQLEHILAGVGMRRRKPQRDAPINGRAIGVEKGEVGCLARRQEAPAHGLHHGAHIRAGHPHDADAAAPGRRGDRRDGHGTDRRGGRIGNSRRSHGVGRGGHGRYCAAAARASVSVHSIRCTTARRAPA